jgi:tetratricopeptide (TPR) repeat protein
MKISILFATLFFCFISCDKKEEIVSNPLNNTLCTQGIVSDDFWYSSGKKAPLFQGLDGVNFPVSTQNEEAKKYFNQGLMLSYAFNHAEAARSFFEASRLDPNFAMAYWGFAYVHGPNYNAVMAEENHAKALEAIQKADSLKSNSSDLEKSLIEALKIRYPENPTDGMVSLDQEYSNAMKKVYEKFSDNPDIGALYAESLLNLHPWDLYEKENKKPKAWTTEIVQLLEELIDRHPNHPGAHHFYIHAKEASQNPEKALNSADVLNKLVPGAGHLVHMPSHIYINTGDYHKGTLSNLAAVKVDSTYTTSCHAQGVYPLTYYPHNYHFLTATATLEGDATTAWMAAKMVQDHTAIELMAQPEWGTLQHYYLTPYYVAVKLELWDEILKMPSPSTNLIYPTAIHHYSKGMAYLGKKDISNAQKELEELKKWVGNKELESITIWEINTTADLVKIAKNVLEAGIAAQQKNHPQSIALLREAIAIEDQLNYNEPPDWFFSVRHYLGSEYLTAGKYKEAESTFREDLKVWKKNGWALNGLKIAMEKQNKLEEAKIIEKEFNQAWQFANFALPSKNSIF